MKQSIKRYLLSLICIAAFGVLTAVEITVDGIKYELDKRKAVLTDGRSCTGDLVLPEGITYEGKTYPVEVIGKNAFYDCISLTSVTLPKWVYRIEWEAFAGCISLTSVTLSRYLDIVEESAFAGCESLTSVNILSLSAWCYVDFRNDLSNPLVYAHKLYLKGELVTNIVLAAPKITDNAFMGCTSITSVTLGDGVTEIGASAFYGCTSLTSFTMSNSVKSIGCVAFKGCTSLPSIDLSNSVDMINPNVFEGCTSLTSVTIGNLVNRIYEGAFYGCTSLTSISIPSSVDLICESAFADCNLHDIQLLASTPPSVWNKPFDDCTFDNATLHVPVGCHEAYATADYWKQFVHIEEDATLQLTSVSDAATLPHHYDLQGRPAPHPQAGQLYIRR